MQVVVTGGGGFVGSHLVDALLERGEHVTCIDINEIIPPRLSHLSNRKNFCYVTADVRSKQTLDAAIPKKCRKIFHLAAIVGVKNYCKDPLATIDVNIGGLKNIIDIALQRDAKVIFTSTSEIYGKNPDVPWREDSDRLLGPTSIDRWTYSSSKAISEHILVASHRIFKLPMVIIRPFNVYGPGQDPIFVIPAMLSRVLNGERPLVYDSGEQTRCFTFISDFVDAIIKSSDNPLAEGEAFNIGSTHEITMTDLARKIIDIAQKSQQLEPEYINSGNIYDSYEDVSRRIPDVSKAQRILSWKANTELEVGLRKTLEFFEAKFNRENKYRKLI